MAAPPPPPHSSSFLALQQSGGGGNGNGNGSGPPSEPAALINARSLTTLRKHAQDELKLLEAKIAQKRKLRHDFEDERALAEAEVYADNETLSPVPLRLDWERIMASTTPTAAATKTNPIAHGIMGSPFFGPDSVSSPVPPSPSTPSHINNSANTSQLAAMLPPQDWSPTPTSMRVPPRAQSNSSNNNNNATTTSSPTRAPWDWFVPQMAPLQQHAPYPSQPPPPHQPPPHQPPQQPYTHNPSTTSAPTTAAAAAATSSPSQHYRGPDGIVVTGVDPARVAEQLANAAASSATPPRSLGMSPLGDQLHELEEMMKEDEAARTIQQAWAESKQKEYRAQTEKWALEHTALLEEMIAEKQQRTALLEATGKRLRSAEAALGPGGELESLPVGGEQN